MEKFSLDVNGVIHTVSVAPDEPLLGVLRDSLGLTGAKYGCGEGLCGSCTVLMDGVSVKSCLLKVSQVRGRKITTVEGLARGDELHPLQKAFLEKAAFQCGYCTPGMILAGLDLLKKNPKPSRDEIVRALEGNLCRCGTYPRIIEAILAMTKRGSDD